MSRIYLTPSVGVNIAWSDSGYWLRGHEGVRNNCFSKIQLVGQKYRDKTTLASKARFSRHWFRFQSRHFSLLVVGYNTWPSSSSTNKNAALIIDHWLDFAKECWTVTVPYFSVRSSRSSALRWGQPSRFGRKREKYYYYLFFLPPSP